MGKIIIKDGIKWDYDWKRNCYQFIEYVKQSQEDVKEDEKPKKKVYPKKRKETD